MSTAKKEFLQHCRVLAARDPDTAASKIGLLILDDLLIVYRPNDGYFTAKSRLWMKNAKSLKAWTYSKEADSDINNKIRWADTSRINEFNQRLRPLTLLDNLANV